MAVMVCFAQAAEFITASQIIKRSEMGLEASNKSTNVRPSPWSPIACTAPVAFVPVQLGHNQPGIMAALQRQVETGVSLPVAASTTTQKALGILQATRHLSC
ncbi:MAG: hypothetical protein R3F37_12225 [Candidatus Competibacteraceae bacterium]